MSFIIDEREAAGNRTSAPLSRAKFLRRHQDEIRAQVKEALSRGSITHTGDSSQDVVISGRDISEPTITADRHSGRRTVVHPGNKEFLPGQKIPRPQGGGRGQGDGPQGSGNGDGEDDFVFSLSTDELLDLYFGDMELPNMVRTFLKDAKESVRQRAGYVSAGNPAKLDRRQTLRKAKRRCIALTLGKQERLCELEALLERLYQDPCLVEEDPELVWLLGEVEELEGLISRVPRFDNRDMTFRFDAHNPRPSFRAVMFCLMDVSGSMDEKRKDLAKRFFTLLYLFLRRSYESIEVVFIRHHESAKVVDEKEFFTAVETGATIVSTVLQEMLRVANERYATGWNWVVAQASDGDNSSIADTEICLDLIRDQIMPRCSYFAYVQIIDAKMLDLYNAYARLLDDAGLEGRFAIRRIKDATDVFPVLHGLFKKRIAGS